MELWVVIANLALGCFITRIYCEVVGGQPRSYTTSSSSGSQTLSSASGFSVSSAESSVNGRCIARITIYGNGIYKVIDYTCTSKPLSVINLDNRLLVADEYYSENRGEVVRLHAGRCDREVFHHYRGTNRYTSTHSAMSKAECDQLNARVVVLKETQKRWDEWYKRRQQESLGQLQQVQTSLASLQQQFFSSIFGT